MKSLGTKFVRFLGIWLVLAGLSMAQAAAAPTPSATSVVVEVGSGKLITLGSPVSNVFIVDTKIAEVRPASPTTLFIFGISPGRTTVAFTDEHGDVLAQYELTVKPSSFTAAEAQAAIARLIPGSHVQVQSHGKGLMLSGNVKNPADAAQAVSIAKGFVIEGAAIDNEIKIDSPIQVTLTVRVAQMSRNVVRNLGLNWQALAQTGRAGGLPLIGLNYNQSSLSITCPASTPLCAGLGFTGVIDALARDNLAHVLAEPNLTVISGQPASFQVGGEYPIPTAQGNGAVGITYKEYGVLLTFVPTVLTDGRINLHVKPEVSELSSLNSVSVTSANATLTIPSLITRRAETTVELGSGESFAIAGMLQQNTNDNANGIPGLSDVPYVGALTRDNQLNRTETELVIVITPYIVRPVANPNALHLPTDGYKPPPDIERLLLMRQVEKQRPPVPVTIPGSAGFIVQ